MSSDPQSVTPTISVVMGTYNGGQFIERQLSSLAGQHRLPLELVICDDGSTDDTLAKIERFAATAPIPVVLHRNEVRLGWRENFQRAAARARGDFVAFCDQDDFWHPDKLERVASVIDEETALVYHGAAIVDANGDRQGRLDRGPRADVRFAPLAAPWWRTPLGFSMVFRASLTRYIPSWERSIDQVDPAERAAHDQWYWFLASVLGSTVFIADELVDYRLHGGNAMGHSLSGPGARDLVAIARATAEKCATKVLILENRIALLAEVRDIDANERTRIDGAITALEEARRFNEQRLQMLSSSNVVERIARLGAVLASRGYTRRLLPEGGDERLRDILAVAVGRRRR